MKAAPHPQQARRLAALHRYAILDTPREPEFDEIASLVARICEAPIAVVNLIDADRQWFKAEVGLGVRETPLESSICSHVILQDDYLEFPDTLDDPRLADNPLCLASENPLRFYAGALLKTDEGLPIGTLCVLDHTPRTLTDTQRQAVQVLARQVMRELDLRQALHHNEIARREIDHRVKNSLASVASVIRMQSRRTKNEEAKSILETTMLRLEAVASLHYEFQIGEEDAVSLQQLFERLQAIFRSISPESLSVNFTSGDFHVTADTASAIAMACSEFATNSIKHGFPDDRPGTVTISATAAGDGSIIVTAADDGIGDNAEPEQTPNGLGMSIMDSWTRKIGATLALDLTPQGARMTLTIPPQNHH